MAKQQELLFTMVPCVAHGIGCDDQLSVILRLSVLPFAEVKIQRSRVQVQALISDIETQLAAESDIVAAGDSDATLSGMEKSLNNLIGNHPEFFKEPWNCSALVAFLDNAPAPPCFNTSTFLLLKNKITCLDYTNNQLTQLVGDLQEKYAGLAHQVLFIQQSMQIQHLDQLEQTEVRPSPTQPSTSDEAPSHEQNNVDSNVSSDSDSSGSALMKDLPKLDLKLDLSSSTNTMASWDAANAGAAFDAPTQSANSVDVKHTHAFSPLSASSVARFNPAAPEFNPRPTTAEATHSPAQPANLSSRPDSLPNSPHLSQQAYAHIPQGEHFNEVIGELIHSLTPHQAQIQYRDSVVALIQRNFRVALNCEALEVGLHRILCFLPDDPIKVSAVLCRNHSTKWHRIICDRLNLIAKRKAEEMAAEGYTYRNDRPEESSDDSTGDHLIRNVVISNSKLSIQVQCNIDNCEVELSCNSRADICILALLEEFSVLVGKNDLFKQSLMLIRAWWSYECAAYVGTSIKYYLSDYALCVMVCAIFNQHHARLHSPLQVFAAFLAEYSAYDGTTSAISLQGIVPFKSATSNQPVLPAALNPTLAAAAGSSGRTSPVKADFLLSHDVMERYWLLYCPPDPSNPEQQQLKILPALSSSSEDVQGVDLSGVMNANFHLDFISAASSVAESRGSNTDEHGNAPSLEETALSAHRQSCTRNLSKFDRSHFNIVDPFTCNNMMLERPSQNRILRLSKVFQTGAAQMAAMLSTAAQQPSADVRSLVKSFFPVSTVRFVESFARPDMFSIDMSYAPPTVFAQMTRKISMKVPLEELARQMRYCNLMVESVISRSAVLDLVVEILTQKGPLPIGEVGKALAELTCITGLSSRLKEAYGGLKKFLEDFSAVVIIGTDHPFNPHIVLRSSLSAEHLALNDSGMFPTHIVLRMKKVTATSIRKGAFLNKPSPQPLNQQGIPQHQGYRPNMPNMGVGNPGIGMGGMAMDSRGVNMAMNTRPEPRGMIPPTHAYGQQGPSGQQAHQQQQQYTAKILSNLHADARDRELSYARGQQAPPPTPLLNPASRTLERHSSGSTNSHSTGTTPLGSFTHFPDVGTSFVSGPSSVASTSNDAFDDYLSGSVQPSPSGSYHKLPYSAQPAPQGDHYHQQQQQQQQRAYPSQDYPTTGFDLQRVRLDSHDQPRRVPPPYPHHSPPNSGRGQVPQQQPQQDRHNVDGHGSFPFPQAPQAQHRDYGQAQQLSRPGSGVPPSYGHGQPSPRQQEFGAPNTAQNLNNNSNFVIDSFFESSTAPLSDPFSRQAPVRAGGFTNNNGGLNGGITGGIGGGINGIGAGREGRDEGPGGRSRVGSLLSGLREGTIELNEPHAHQQLQQQQGREWDAFHSPPQDFLGGGGDWRGQQSHQDRKY